MVFKIPESIVDLYFYGDNHGRPEYITYQIKQHLIKDAAIILCGDVGFGFESLEHYTNNVIPQLEKTLKKSNVIIYCVRGNHEDPKYYSEQLINTDYIKCVPDYSVIQFKDKNILCVGGGISIDRTYRIKTNSINIVNYMKWHNCQYEFAEKNAKKCYWEDEQIVYQPKIDERIDIIATHSAPSFCFPSFKGDFVLKWAEYDDKLLADIDKERSTLDLVYNDYKDTVTHWYYGHFHKSNCEIINNTTFRLLNIDELFLHVTDDNYSL